MSHGKLREEKNCLNCGATVEHRYCPECGQENIETRQPFYYLITHFIEDFTHYDGKFWKTIKLLALRPGFLTQEYLAGRREKYVPPVKLYIFVSFITFFLSTILPSDNLDDHSVNTNSTTQVKKDKKHPTPQELIHEFKKENYITKDKSLELIEKLPIAKNDSTKIVLETDNIVFATGIETIEDFDNKYHGIGHTLSRPFIKKYLDLKEEGLSNKEISEKFSDTFMHSLSKALFIYLPIFAFIMWLFHDKKKWYYFDHGVFTLHYFSFILISIVSLLLLDTIEDFADNSFISLIYGLYMIGVIMYWFIYFFIAHKKVFQAKKHVSAVKSLLLLLINSILVVILLLSLTVLSFLMIH